MRTRSFHPKSDANQRAVALFLAYLDDLPLVAWIEAARGRALLHGTDEAQTALRAAERELLSTGQPFAVKEAVLHALQRFETPDGRRLTRTRYATEHLRVATENAALALLARQRLHADQFATLYAPFERVIPIALVLGIAD